MLVADERKVLLSSGAVGWRRITYPQAERSVGASRLAPPEPPGAVCLHLWPERGAPVGDSHSGVCRAAVAVAWSEPLADDLQY